MKVLLFTGYSGFTQRLDNVFHMLQQELGFGLDCLVFGPDNADYLRTRAKATYGRIVCCEDMIAATPAGRPGAEALEALEAEFGHSLTYLAYSERYLVSHTHHLRQRREPSQDEVVAQVVHLCREIMALLEGISVVYVYACASIQSEILYYACKARGIPFLTTFERRMGYQFSLVRNNQDRHDDVLALYRDPRFAVTAAGQARFETFRGQVEARAVTPARAYQADRLRGKRLNAANLARFVRTLFDGHVSKRSRLTRWQRVVENVRFKQRQRYIDRHLERQLPDRPFVYFPLAMVPESSTLVLGMPHYDQLGLIKQLSLQLPLDWVLLVREHPTNVGTMDTGLYREVKRIFNARMVSPAVDATLCTARAEAVVTITGTTGLEALALGKKTIVLGRCVYSDLDSVIRPPALEAIGDILRRPWTDVDRARQAADLARFASALEAVPGIEDPDKLIWTKAAFDPAVNAYDLSLFHALKAELAPADARPARRLARS